MWDVSHAWFQAFRAARLQVLSCSQILSTSAYDPLRKPLAGFAKNYILKIKAKGLAYSIIF
jgi:hypothetical protein